MSRGLDGANSNLKTNGGAEYSPLSSLAVLSIPLATWFIMDSYAPVGLILSLSFSQPTRGRTAVLL
jgi:hypothetical protein